MKLETAYRISTRNALLGSHLHRHINLNGMVRPFTWGRAFMLASLAALGVGTVANHASAQVQIHNGNALDASNQIGSGGSNNPIPGYVPLNPNVVGYTNSATGMYNTAPRLNYQVVPVTLPGGGTSYARIPQLGQSSFNTSIPASAMPLYNVNAISSGVPSSVVNSAMGAQAAFASQGALVQNPIANPYSPYSINGQVYATPAYLSPYTSSPYALQNSNNLLPGTGVSANTNPGDNGMPTNSNSGVVGQISPLFGLRQVSVQQAVTSQLPNPFGTTAGNTTSNSSSQQNQSGNNPQNNPTFNNVTPSNVGTSQLTNPQAVNGNVNNTNNVQPNGQAIQASIGGQHVPGQVGGGTSLYQQLLTELRSGKSSNIVAPGLPGKPAITQTDLTPQTQQNLLTIDPITGLPIAPITSKRLIGVANGNNTSANSTVNADNTGRTIINTPNGPTEVMQPSGATINGNISSTLSSKLQAGWKINALTSLAGGTPGNFGLLMRNAEADQKNGRYVSAIENYQSAINLRPGNALPMIGQANAELAAGLYQSAAYNLKFVFVRHPELTSVRYDLNAMLPSASLKASHQELHTMFTRQSALAAFLLAYLDYQTGRTVELKSTLKQWATWKNSGTWPTIFTKAWIKAGKQSAANPAGSGTK